MTTPSAKALGLLALAGSALYSRPSHATDAPAGPEVSGAFGYGVSSGVDVIGLGVGARLGYAMDSRFYVGALGLLHFGSSDPGEPDVDHRSETLKLELGYDIDLLVLDLRPALRAGYTHVTTPRDADGAFWTPDIGAGATVYVRLDGPFLGFDVDARLMTRLVNNGDVSFALSSVAAYWVLGYRF